MNLQNAVVNTGDPIYWDENSGVGCGSQGCPSLASENSVGTIPSEAFTILGSATTTTCNFDCPPQCPSNQGDFFSILHDFTSSDGSPSGNVAIDPRQNVYGTTGNGGVNGYGLAFKLGELAQNWLFTPLYNFLGGTAGENPSPEIIGPDGTLYGVASGGLQQCGTSGRDYCGVVYRLRPPPTACLTALCSWNETVIYQFMGAPDGAQPNGNLVFGGGGTLYGTTYSGGAYGGGSVFELTPSAGGWTEKVIYSFPGPSAGLGPTSLLLGRDNNLYGSRVSSNNGAGIIFQLVPSGDNWTENTIYSDDGCTQFSGYCGPLLFGQYNGNFYALDRYNFQVCNPNCQWYGYTVGEMFELSSSPGGWQQTILDDTYQEFCTNHDWCNDPGATIFAGGSVDAAGDVFGTLLADEGCPYCFGYVFKLVAPYEEQGQVYFEGPDFTNVEAGIPGKLYGTTGACGNSKGTVWQVTLPTQARLNTIYNFTGGADGANPFAGLRMDAAGNLYGTAFYGGTSSNCNSNGCGTVFELSKQGGNWNFATLYSFNGLAAGDGAGPQAPVTFGPDGALYGTTNQGGGGSCYHGCGTVYSLSPGSRGARGAPVSWTENVLYKFQGGTTDGAAPFGEVALDQAGNVYGVTQYDGPYDVGTVYQVTLSSGGWTENQIHSFTGGADGADPYGGVLFDQSGNLYGTAQRGGNLGCSAPYGCGLAFQFSPNGSGWTENTVYDFSSSAYSPAGDLARDSAGNLYGVTQGQSVVFMLSPSGSNWIYTPLYALPNGTSNGVTIDAAGNLYGSSPQGGANRLGYVYELSPGASGWTFTDLHDFTGNDGRYPDGTVLVDADGHVYGTAQEGGASGSGTVWEIVKETIGVQAGHPMKMTDRK